jgi:hypothetical protein
MSDKKSKQQLNEIRLSWAGKLFFAGVAARLAQVGLKNLANSMEEQAEEGSEQGEIGFPFKLQGTPEQIAATQEVIRASKEYQEELKRDGATVETVMEKLNAQNVAKKAFEEKTGKAWPL